MFPFKSILALVFVVAVAAAFNVVGLSDISNSTHKTASGFTKIYKVNINDLVDNNIEEIQRNLYSLDPATLEDVTFKYLLVSLELTKGYIQNIPHVDRLGDCILTYQNRNLTADFNMVWRDVAFDYRYLYKAWPISKIGDFHGQMYDLFANIAITYDFVDKKVYLEKFEFVRVGNLKMFTEGNIIDSIGKIFSKIFTKVLKNSILQVIRKELETMVEHRLPQNPEDPMPFLTKWLERSHPGLLEAIKSQNP